MGWFSNAFSWIGKAVSTVVSTVKTVYKKACSVVSSVVNGVKKVANTVVSYVKKGCDYVVKKAKQVNDWFWNTSVGKGITKFKDYVMDKTPIGSAIRWGVNKVT